MDSYEGETVRLQRPCPLCQGTMEEGFLYIPMANNAIEWMEGAPQRSRWTRTILNTRRYVTSTFRCEQCGFLASFATTAVTVG